jgi:cobalt/nickel transport system permease protein
MHIPDGYLSPETCALLYAGSVPFWSIALRRVKKLVSTQFLPLISVFAAFSFVVMMFNLPLPGGTTGHAVGVGIAAVVLGPWASILAVSIALVIQSLFFGDGGVTAIGANCFNMAIVGSMVAYGCYRGIARWATLGAHRRVVAAAIAGYAAINVSALCAAIEFGVQPLLFHDAAGVPLYCPYPLKISIPAMMIGHLTFAGLAELVITAGVVAYLQRADSSFLRRTAPEAPDVDCVFPELPQAPDSRTVRRLWLALGVLLILTPLGILAAGSAWGEWSPQELGAMLPAAKAPVGIERLSSIWTAPVSRYAPAFVRSESFGYLVSAMIGVGLIILLALAASVVIPKRDAGPVKGKLRRGFVEATVRSLLETVERAVLAEEIAKSRGLLQGLDARVKLAGLMALVIAAATVHQVKFLGLLFVAGVIMAAASRVPFGMLAAKVWMPALVFSGLIALPSIFLTRGSVIYEIPGLGWKISHQGVLTASLLLLRVETAATFSALLVLTTEWVRVLRALRFFRVPVTAVVILGMTYRYVFLFLKTAREMFESRQSRLVGVLAGPDRRRLAAGSVGVLLSKSFQLSSDVHFAMRSRGFHGETYVLEEPAITAADWVQLAAFVAAACAVVILGR